MRGVSSVSRQLHRSVLPVLVILAASIAAAAADGPGAQPDSVFAAVRAAIARGHVEKTRQQGFDQAKNTFRDVPREGGLLIGFDVGLGKSMDREVIYALRPLYLTEDGEIPSERYGLFTDKRLPNQTLKTKVMHQVRVKAKPGYAVGSVTLRTGLAIDGMSLTFMRIAGQALDPRDTYVGEWIGNSSGGGEGTLGGNGNLIVGIFGCQDEHDVRALGLLYVAGTPPAAGAPAAPPTVPKHAVLPAEPADLPAAAAPDGQPAAEAPSAPPAETAHKTAKEHSEFSAALIWLPFLAFGGVFILFAAALVMFSSRKEKRAAGAADKEKGAVAVARRPRQPAVAAEDDALVALPADDDQVTAAPPVAPPPAPQAPRLECPPIPATGIENQATARMAIASLALGVASLVVCCLPILGLPVSVTGLILGIKGQHSVHQSKAVIGICLNMLGLAVAVINGLLWVRFFVTSASLPWRIH